MTGSRSEIVYEALPQDDPTIRQPDITLATRAARVGADHRPGAGASQSPSTRSPPT